MDDPQAVALLQEVLDKTQAGRIGWEPTANEDEFVASIGGKFALLIKSYTYIDQGVKEGAPVLILKDADDREVLTVTSTIEGVNRQDLQDLYSNVFRQALRVEQKVDDLLTELRKL